MKVGVGFGVGAGDRVRVRVRVSGWPNFHPNPIPYLAVVRVGPVAERHAMVDEVVVPRDVLQQRVAQ